jgi:hypothetical protein
MIATLTKSLKNHGARDPESTLEATATGAQLAISKQTKAKQIRTRSKFPGSILLKERIPKKSRSDQHAHEMISLNWKSIHHFTKQAGNNLYTHHCRHQAAAGMENVKFVGNLQCKSVPDVCRESMHAICSRECLVSSCVYVNMHGN